MHEAFLAAELESPFDQKWFDRPSHDHLVTTKVDITGYYPIRSAALRAHATQIDPAERFWFGLPDDVVEASYPWEDFELADARVPTSVPEDDLFAGLREGAAA
jgi:mycothiol S-conjugate amidase